MARRLLDAADDDFARIFGEILLLKDHDGSVVVEAEAAVEFYVRAKSELPNDPEMLASLHFRAAHAIMGFLQPSTDRHRLDLSASLSARWFHEAQWHLEQAVGRSEGPHNSTRLIAI